MAIVIGHRGARALAPENTLEGIRVAAMCRADRIEVDVRLSKDGALVIMHDEVVDRTTKGHGKVEDLSLEELKALGVPTLEEVARLCCELGMGMVVEMKEEGLEELVVSALQGTDALVTSFYHSSLREIKEISGLKTGIILTSLPIHPVEVAVWAKADAIFPNKVNSRLFEDAHRQGIKAYPWTINTPEGATWMLRLGADGLVTDDPCLIRDVISKPLENTSQANCKYYPCHHFEGQICTHCYCPLYPCKDPDLGRFVRTKRGKRVWTCIDCDLVHRLEVAEYLEEHPSASTEDLKSLKMSG
jgi:glycerophosphoryl diester phosphodiesterase